MEPYIGDIRMFAAAFSPVNYAFCNGQALAIVDNQALYALIATTYGGDGVNSFNLPGLQSRIPVHIGKMPNGGAIDWTLGMASGTESVSLTTEQIPEHTHPFVVSSAEPSTTTASNNSIAKGRHYVDSSRNPTIGSLYSQVLQPVGNNLPHNNMMPILGINFIIALNGVFPNRN